MSLLHLILLVVPSLAVSDRLVEAGSILLVGSEFRMPLVALLIKLGLQSSPFIDPARNASARSPGIIQLLTIQTVAQLLEKLVLATSQLFIVVSELALSSWGSGKAPTLP